MRHNNLINAGTQPLHRLGGFGFFSLGGKTECGNDLTLHGLGKFPEIF